jgi:hypothetical protein
MNGLRMTRKYKYWTFFVRLVSRALTSITLDPLEKLAIMIGLIKKPQKTLLWTKEHTHLWDPIVPQSLLPTQPHNSNASPSIPFEVIDHLAAAPHRKLHVYDHDTPAMSHSGFPPTIPTHRPRAGSDVSNPALSHSPPRISDDSSRPLMLRPSEAYHPRGDAEGRSSEERRVSSEGRVSFGDTLSPPSPPNQGGWPNSDTTLQPGQGYRRANSNARSPLVSSTSVQSGLGIRLGNEDLEKGRLHDQV